MQKSGKSYNVDVLSNGMRISLILSSFLVCLFLFAWALSSIGGYAPNAVSGQPVPDGQKSYEEFRETIKSFPYSASEERKKQIAENYTGLRVGMSKEQVAALIGNPDYSQSLFGPKGFRQHWQGSSWKYRLFMREDGVNLNDPTIEVFFDTAGVLSWAVPSGISGLLEIGKCCKESN